MKPARATPTVKTLNPLMLAPPTVQGIAAEGLWKGAWCALEDDGGEGGDRQQDTEGSDKHDEGRPRPFAHAHIQAPVEGEADSPCQQA